MDLYDDETAPNLNSGDGDTNPQMWYNQTVWSTCIYTPVSVSNTGENMNTIATLY